ncbi:hypothetical protein [Microbacterium immunditiarum]|uniref:Uncharacterized protein n=1 Tax=Microbacterium immunditiarum TaxID=337480 RepID=A0A7Y9GTZ3_9MICO|nr:hypothetical protein [Microbacterium immunditiarum]NYE21605.1 hypothetical protein [Microbacterium immunditiarum]
MEHIVSDARDASIRNTATAISDAVDCFTKLQITTGEDLDSLAKQNGLCGDWRALGATDEQLSAWKWDVWNNTWLIRIDESAGPPVITAMTVGSGQAQVGIQQEAHLLVVCWQVTLDPSVGEPPVTGFECPEQWSANMSAPEVMTMDELKDAASNLGVTLTG